MFVNRVKWTTYLSSGGHCPKERARTRNATPLPNSLNSSAHEVRSFRGLFRCSTIPAQKSAHPFSGIDQPGLPATFPSRHPHQLMTSCRVRAKAAARSATTSPASAAPSRYIRTCFHIGTSLFCSKIFEKLRTLLIALLIELLQRGQACSCR
jgi:hypothetical protein